MMCFYLNVLFCKEPQTKYIREYIYVYMFNVSMLLKLVNVQLRDNIDTVKKKKKKARERLSSIVIMIIYKTEFAIYHTFIPLLLLIVSASHAWCMSKCLSVSMSVYCSNCIYNKYIENPTQKKEEKNNSLPISYSGPVLLYVF